MRCLFVTPMLPLESAQDLAGKHRRVAIFLRALTLLGSRIDLACIVPRPMLALAADQHSLDRSQSDIWGLPVRVRLVPRQTRAQSTWTYYGAGIFHASQQPPLYPYAGSEAARGIGELLDTAPDIVFVDRIEGMLPVLGSHRRPRTVLLDIDDIGHKVLWRSAFGRKLRPGQLASSLQLPALLALERRAVARSTMAFVCSPTDRRHLRLLGFGDRIAELPNAVAVPETAPGVCRERTVLFLGAYHHPPNVLAAERLARRVWPIVRARVPDATLLIAGSQSALLPSNGAALPGVRHLGFIEDLGALYAGSRLVCCPITTGSGTRLKLLEAASYARPIVSTRIGAEGLDFRDGEDILLRDRDQDLAEACILLLGDDALCLRLGERAREAIRLRYDVGVIARRVAETIKATMQ